MKTVLCKALRKALALSLALVMILPMGLCSVFADAVSGESGQSSGTNLDQIKDLLNALSYRDYMARLSSSAIGTQDIKLSGAKYDASKTDADVFLVNDLDGKTALVTPETGKTTWEFVVTAPGLYNVEISYYPLESYDKDKDGNPEVVSKGNTVERAILIDGEYPFKESRYCEFQRVWTEKYVQCIYVTNKAEGATYQYREKGSEKWIPFVYDGYVAVPVLAEGQQVADLYEFCEVIGEASRLMDPAEVELKGRAGFELDKFGNEIRPEKVQAPEWSVKLAADSTGYEANPFAYYLTAGTHTITLEAVKEPVAIEHVRLYAGEVLSNKVLSYQDYVKQFEGKGAPAVDKIRIDAEMPSKTSHQILYPTYDRSSAITDPQDAALIYLNTVGSDKWTTVGQWIEWEFVVPEAGMYNIAPRFIQDGLAGMYVSRTLMIDGKVPFAEASKLQFNYSTNWQCAPLGDANGAYSFYLEQGAHTIRMEVVLGNMAQIIQEVEQSLNNINNCYLKVLMLTGPDPDDYRDYEFESHLPDVIQGFRDESKRLYDISKRMEEIIGEKGDHSVTLDNIAQLCQMMGENEDNIAPSFDTLKTYIGNLGTWIMETRNQPLEFDFIEIVPAGGQTAPADANFFEMLGYELSQFIMSFFSDYSGYGARSSTNATRSIEVWTSTGRDQASIIRSMISDDFTTNSNIMVDLKLITASTLLPATLSGTGPDVAMTIGTGDIVNYAIRHAVLPLQEMEGFEEHVKSSFSPSAMIPLTMYGQTYALPEAQSFSVLFYRMDILAQMGVDIPETWDDIYAMLPELQTNYLQVGMPNSLAGLTLFLYQREDENGKQVQLYKGDRENDPDKKFGMEINLDSDVALDCFKQMSEFFTMYDFPKTYEAANRFRSGEMPLLIADYTLYSQLTIFAPEIRGLWGFTVIPGTVNSDDGKVNHTVNSGVNGIMMLHTCEDKEAAWEYMKWWTGKNAQSEYGNEYKALLGASGQYATANMEALKSMPWTASEMQTLEECFGWLTATPEMPGGYIIARNVEFAFLRVYNDSADPVESMMEYIDAINSELSRKRKEFDLPIREDFIGQE